MTIEDVNKLTYDNNKQMQDEGSADIYIDISDEEDESLFEDPGSVLDDKEHFDNLVEVLDEDTLNQISMLVQEGVDTDIESREEFMRVMKLGVDLMGIEIKELNEPFKGACSAQHPLLMENAVKFQAKASAELLPADGPVQVKVIGDATLEKEQQALRVQNHMNYQVTEEMCEYYTDTEKLLLATAINGSAFKKTYYDDHLERPVSEYVSAEDFIINNGEIDLERAERFTHRLTRSKNQMAADFAAGMYKKPEDCDLIPSDGSGAIEDYKEKASSAQGFSLSLEEEESFILYEQHLYLFIEELEEDELKLEFEVASPYVVTIDEVTGQVLSIRRNWYPDDEKRKRINQFTHWGFVPGFGFYCYGYLHLLGNLQLSLTSSLRSLVDAGQFGNLQGGFKLKGVRIVDNEDAIGPGEFRDIDAGIIDIKNAIMPLPFKGADQTLFQMLKFIDAKGQQFADSTEQTIADASNMGPVGTTLALLDASTKFFSGVHKRLHLAQKKELKIIADINGKTLDDDIKYNELNEKGRVTREDYDERVDIVPVSDPNISSNAHRMAKAQTLLDIALKVPEEHNMREVLKHVYINMDYPNIEKILPEPEEAKPQDPLTDIQSAIKGKPIKAFPEQDHQSHLQIKGAFIQDPNSGNNPLMAKAKMAIQANMQEHMVMEFALSAQAQAENTGQSLEEATKAIARMNNEKMQMELEAQKNKNDEVARTLAQAELLQEMTQAEKLEFEKRYKTAQLELDKERLDLDREKEFNKLIQTDAKAASDIDKIVTTKGLDVMTEALQKEHFGDEEKPDKKEEKE